MSATTIRTSIDAAQAPARLRTWLIKANLFLASILVTAFIFGFEAALVITYAVFVHEAGHVKAATWMNLRTKGVYFLPLIGAVAVSETPRSRGQEVVVQLMGPLFGLLSVVPLAAAAVMTGDPRWWHYAFLTAALNLFNLLPVGSLDGGQILLAIAQSVGRRTTVALFGVGLGVGLVCAWTAQSWIMAAIFALSAGVCAWSMRKAPRTTPRPLSRAGMAMSAIAYAGLFAALSGTVGLTLSQYYA